MHFIGIFFVILLVAAAVWFVENTKSGDTNNGWPRIERSSPHPHALKTLKERYARGEIGREEYLQKKRDIEK